MGDISLIYLLGLAWKRIWALITAMVVFAAAAFCYCQFAAEPRYTATASILATNGAIVDQSSNNQILSEDSVKSTDISASLTLANTIVEILKTPDAYMELADTLGGDYTYSNLKSMITVERRDTNNLFIDITVKAGDGAQAQKLANEFAKLSCSYVLDFIPSVKAMVVSTSTSFTKVYPRTLTVTGISGIVGAIVAFVIAFIADSLNQSIRGEDEFISKYSLPLLGSVPDFENDDIITSYRTRGSETTLSSSAQGEQQVTQRRTAPFAVVEAYKSIRSNLCFLLEKSDKGNVIAITSSNAEEGKSTTAVNLAVAFSQLEDRILIIDADLRRSSIHKKLHIENDKGLSNVLAGMCDFEEAVKKLSDRLHILTSGQIPPNPSEMLSSKRFSNLIEKLREAYDYIIIDTPPLNVVSDALVIVPNTDGFAFVLRDGFTPNYTIKRALASAEFAKVKTLGAIMNGANPKSQGKYIYRKYSYRSQYYNRYYKYGYDKHYGGYANHRKNVYSAASKKSEK